MFDFLESGIDLDASGYAEGGDEAIAVSHDVADATDDAGESLIAIDKRGIAAGAALAGVGTGMQSVLDDTQALRESLGRTAASTELTSDEATGLARSLSDATFPLEDATATMDALAQQGVETEEDMQRLALASDNLADATGTSAESIASDLGPAVRGLDGDLDALEDSADTFTTVIRGTTLEADDLGRVIERSSEELQEMGVSSDEAAQMVAAYADETGKSGRQASRDFSSAVRDADGDMEELKNELGLTEEQIRAFSGELEENQGATDRHSEAANESLTTMDSLRASYDSARLALGDYLGPVSAAAPALQGLGAASMAYSTINFGAVIPSVAGVVATASPLLPLLIPLAGVIAGVGYAWKNDWIDPVETATWAAGRLTDGIDWLGDKVLWAAEQVARFYPPIRLAREVWDRNLFGIQDSTETAFSLVGDAIDWLIDKVNAIPGVNIGGDDVDVDEDAVEDAGEDTAAAFEAGRDDALEDEPAGVRGIPGEDDEPIDTNLDAQTRPSVPDDEPDVDTDPADRARSPTTRGMDADDLAEAVREALDGVGLVLDGTIETDEGHIVNIAEGVLTGKADRARRME